MYTPAINYRRKNGERVSSKQFWDRDDRAFFAAGACHILAYTFLQLHPDEGYKIVFIKPKTPQGTHVYITDGHWAFDFNGWTLESELLVETERAEKHNNPDWSYEKIVISDDIESFSKENDHCPPSDFYMNPMKRAQQFGRTCG